MTLCLARPETERSDSAIIESAILYAHVLIGTIPYERLGDAYKQAMIDHRSNFSLSTSDFLSAWEKIKANERSSKKVQDPCIFCINHSTNPEVRPCPFHG